MQDQLRALGVDEPSPSAANEQPGSAATPRPSPAHK
jgi:hypothetical protein